MEINLWTLESTSVNSRHSPCSFSQFWFSCSLPLYSISRYLPSAPFPLFNSSIRKLSSIISSLECKWPRYLATDFRRDVYASDTGGKGDLEDEYSARLSGQNLSKGQAESGRVWVLVVMKIPAAFCVEMECLNNKLTVLRKGDPSVWETVRSVKHISKNVATNSPNYTHSGEEAPIATNFFWSRDN